MKEKAQMIDSTEQKEKLKKTRKAIVFSFMLK